MIDVRGAGPDIVGCGSGSDLVRADLDDQFDTTGVTATAKGLCQGRAVLTATNLGTIGIAEVALSPGETSTVELVLTARAVSRLKRAAISSRPRVVVADNGGAARLVRVTVTLKRTPAAKKKQRAVARRS